MGFSGLSLLVAGLAGADAAVGSVGTGEGRGDRDRDLSSWALCAMWLACRPLVFLVGGALDTELWHWILDGSSCYGTYTWRSSRPF